MARHTGLITVWVKWQSGATKLTVPFWQSDESIFASIQRRMPWIKGPFTVDREAEHGNF